MKYTVVTSAVADHQLIEIWLNAPDRQRAASAFNRIEYLLKHDAHLLGRSIQAVGEPSSCRPLQ